MESLNSLFSAVKPKARGYRTVEFMAATLYFVAGILTRWGHCHTQSGEGPGNVISLKKIAGRPAQLNENGSPLFPLGTGGA